MYFFKFKSHSQTTVFRGLVLGLGLGLKSIEESNFFNFKANQKALFFES